MITTRTRRGSAVAGTGGTKAVAVTTSRQSRRQARAGMKSLTRIIASGHSGVRPVGWFRPTEECQTRSVAPSVPASAMTRAGGDLILLLPRWNWTTISQCPVSSRLARHSRTKLGIKSRADGSASRRQFWRWLHRGPRWSWTHQGLDGIWKRVRHKWLRAPATNESSCGESSPDSIGNPLTLSSIW
jgi:hypothetical protein